MYSGRGRSKSLAGVKGCMEVGWKREDMKQDWKGERSCSGSRPETSSGKEA